MLRCETGPHGGNCPEARMSERVDETAAKAGGGPAGKPRLRVLLVDDHRVMRAGPWGGGQ